MLKSCSWIEMDRLEPIICELRVCFLLSIAWHFYFINLLLYPVKSFCNSLLSVHILISKNVLSFAGFLTSLLILLFQFINITAHGSQHCKQDYSDDLLHSDGWLFISYRFLSFNQLLTFAKTFPLISWNTQFLWKSFLVRDFSKKS